MNDSNSTIVESKIRCALGNAPAPDFTAWEKENADAVQSLGATRSKNPTLRYRLSLRISLVAAASILLIAGAFWGLFPKEEAFAKTIYGINMAETITWVRTSYQRGTSKDGKRYWLEKRASKHSYMEPGYFRCDDYDKDGALEKIYIDDPVKKQRLALYVKVHKFEIEEHKTYLHVDDKEKEKPVAKLKLNVGPFGWLNRAMHEGGKIVEQRTVDGRKVDVLRWHNLMMGQHNPKNVSDVWIDAETEQLVGLSHPGSSVFDPETLDYCDNPPENSFSSMKFLGSVTKDIVLGAEVDSSIFEFNIPEGFTKVAPRKPAPTITEQELVQWLEVLAKVNDGQFVDGIIIENTKKIALANQKEVNEKSEDEKAMGDIWYRHMLGDNTRPFWDFLEQNTLVEDYRYFGKGVKLGTADKIVLLYRPKLTGNYRALYGDMRIEDISDADAKALSVREPKKKVDKKEKP